MQLSIIIPTLNEANYLSHTLRAVYERVYLSEPEVIVVDAGSHDATVAIAERFPATVIVDESLRGSKWRSLNRGAAEAKGDVYLFLDADGLVPVDYDQAIQTALEKRNTVGGAFEFAFDQRSFLLWYITWVNRVRYRFRKRFYGDQGIFVTRQAFARVGGWPPLQLMEAAYFCKNLQAHGRLRIVPLPLKVSARRFVEGGIMQIFWHDVRVWALDLLGRDVQRFAETYWQQNERRTAPAE